MRRRSLRMIIIASMLVLCIASCGLLLDRLPPPADASERLRMCMQSAYDVQYCLGLVPTVPSMYPRLYYSTPEP